VPPTRRCCEGTDGRRGGREGGRKREGKREREREGEREGGREGEREIAGYRITPVRLGDGLIEIHWAKITFETSFEQGTAKPVRLR
jgi:hypothetical protein